MSRYITAPRGVTTFDNVAATAQSVAGTPLNPIAGTAPDWFKGGYPYNLTSTPADAAKLAGILAQKLATYLVEYSVVAKNCLRLAIPRSKATKGALINVPTAATVFPSGVPTYAYWSNVDGAYPWSGSANGQLGNFGDGTFTVGTTQTVNPKFVLQSDALIDFLARDMAIGYLDAGLLTLYNQFTANDPLGANATLVTTAVLTAAIAAIAGNAAYQAGAPIFIVLGERDVLGINTIALQPTPGYIAADFVAGRRRLYSAGVLAEIFGSPQVNTTGGGANNQGLAFAPSAIGLATSAIQSPTTDPNSTTPLSTANIVSSTAVSGFVASVKFGLAAASGNNFAFNVYPNIGIGVIDNGCGVRILS